MSQAGPYIGHTGLKVAVHRVVTPALRGVLQGRSHADPRRGSETR